jgi:hypothetical protein
VRGIRARVVVLDELAFYRNSEGNPVDTEMLRACRPALATTGGKLIVLSSPYGQSGALYDLHRRHFGRDESGTLVWQASAPEMNPTLPADYLARMAADDPDAYRSEVLGEFRPGIATFLDPDIIAAAVDRGVRERAPRAGVRYVAFADPSGGRHDAFALGIAHSDRERGAVLDVLRAWPAPFNPAGVIEEACGLLRRYRVREVEGDRYSGEFAAERFREHGVTYRPSDRDRSAIYLDFLPALNAGQALLLDDADLLRELRGLARRRGTSGRDRVDHAPGGHDDRANAAAGALVLAGSGRRCRSPYCEDPECDGRGPMLMFSAESEGWLSKHPEPEAIAEVEAALAADEAEAGGAPVEEEDAMGIGARIAELAAAGYSKLTQRTAERRMRREERERARDGRIGEHVLSQQRKRDAKALEEKVRRGGGAWFPDDF